MDPQDAFNLMNALAGSDPLVGEKPIDMVRRVAAEESISISDHEAESIAAQADLTVDDFDTQEKRDELYRDHALRVLHLLNRQATLILDRIEGKTKLPTHGIHIQALEELGETLECAIVDFLNALGPEDGEI